MKANQISICAFTWDEWDTFKKFFWIKESKIYTKSENLGAINYIGLHVWTLALGGIYHGDKIEIFTFDSGNILNMFQIQKYWYKISQTDGYLHSKMHCLILDLLSTTILGTIFFSICFCLEVSFLTF